MMEGKLIYNDSLDRYELEDEDGSTFEFHCGHCLEVFYMGEWRATRFEIYDNGEWYLVGYPTAPIDGMDARTY